MKYVLNMTIIAMLFMLACHKNIRTAQVPEEIITSFNQRYPEATRIEWEEDAGFYEVEFMDGDIKKEATYSSDGNLLDVAEKM